MKDPVPATLADVIVRLQQLRDLTPTRRRDLVSAVRRTAGLLGRGPETIPANLRSIRSALEQVHPAQQTPPLSHKTWINLRSNLLKALHLTGAPATPRGSRLAHPWDGLFAALPDAASRNGLSQFLRYLSAADITPAMISDATLPGFAAHLRETTLLLPARQRELIRTAAKAWNLAAVTVAGWPPQLLAVPSYRKPRQTLHLDQMPPSLSAEIEAYLQWTAGADPFNAPPRPSRPLTQALERSNLQLAVSAWVHRGHPLEDLQSLRDLVEPVRVREILRHYITKPAVAGEAGKARPTAHAIAKLLLKIARRRVKVDDTQMDALRTISRQLGPERSGLTVKNRDMLRQFDAPENVQRLLALPDTLVREAGGLPTGSVHAAVLMQTAVVIEILLMAPIRSKNLAGLRFGHSLVRPGGKTGPWHIRLEEAETKTSEPLEYPLPDRLSAMIDEYRRRYRPALVNGTDAGYLLPSTMNDQKGQSTIALQTRVLIRKHTGLRMSLHQFRHLAAKILLDAAPGNYQAASHLLGHANPKTTVKMYTGLRTQAAARHFDGLIEKLREKHETAAPPAPTPTPTRAKPRSGRKPRRKPGKRPGKDQSSDDDQE